MKLSIIIPVYNVAPWLPAAVSSVLDQTWKDFELILVDDGATDGSGELCDAFALADSRVRVIHQKNGGVSAARNAGLDAAGGEFIGWVDSDDLIEQDMFEVMLSWAEKEQADIVQCFHDRAQERNPCPRAAEAEIMDGPGFVRRMFTKKSNEYTNQVALWSKIYRRTLWEEIRFPVGQVYEDEMQTYKVCLKAKKILEISDVLYHYIYRRQSIITGESPKKMLDKQAALLDRLQYLPAKLPELEEPCARKFLQFSENILCRLYERQAETELAPALQRLNSLKDRLRPYMSRYEKLYLPLLGCKWGRKWVLGSDFEPLQKLLQKLKQR